MLYFLFNKIGNNDENRNNYTFAKYNIELSVKKNLFNADES